MILSLFDNNLLNYRLILSHLRHSQDIQFPDRDMDLMSRLWKSITAGRGVTVDKHRFGTVMRNAGRFHRLREAVTVPVG